ncbi:MAG: dTDP-4-dehydrorhamnose 3,5-epimerase [Candidatus Omnitrophica bacterium]|nr:dTDP-4-dehydrorhamnose 3,5-epimerase [Candidatus Omnitrophota bacterium]
MIFTPAEIEGLIVVDPRLFEDERGYFYESYRKQIFEKNGIQPEFVQDNHVKSQKGVIRALHFQKEPYGQAKLIRVIKGSIYDVAVDLRAGSPTFGQYAGIHLSAENHKMFYIPEGFAHGYCSLEDSEVLYKVSGIYAPEYEGGIVWNDPAVGVKWPELDVDYIISAKDQKLLGFKQLFGDKR